MNKYTVKAIYELNEIETTYDSAKEAHDAAMEIWFWGALSTEVYDPSGKCIEIHF
jgi:hypothetical protein